MKRVYFFGAGLSKAINSEYPTLMELTDVVTKNFLLRHKDSPLEAHYKNIPSELKNNLELMLSYLFSDWPWKTTADQELDMSLYRHLTYEIGIWLSSIETADIAQEFEILVRYLRSHKHGIVTLNYDTLVEKISQIYWLPKDNVIGMYIHLHIEDSYDDDPRTSEVVPYVIDEVQGIHPLDMVKKRIIINRDFARAATKTQISDIASDPRLKLPSEQQKYLATFPSVLEAYVNTIRLASVNKGLDWRTSKLYKSTDESALQNRILKLHGSMDWVDENSETIRVASDSGQPAQKIRLPLIVPPILDKTRHYTNNKLRDIWFGAHSMMEKAEEIIIAGFSFPVTDLSIRYLFQSVMNRNQNVRIVVVNRDTEARLRHTYDQVFSGEWASHVDYRYCGRDDSLLAYIRAEIIRE